MKMPFQLERAHRFHGTWGYDANVDLLILLPIITDEFNCPHACTHSCFGKYKDGVFYLNAAGAPHDAVWAYCTLYQDALCLWRDPKDGDVTHKITVKWPELSRTVKNDHALGWVTIHEDGSVT